MQYGSRPPYEQNAKRPPRKPDRTVPHPNSGRQSPPYTSGGNSRGQTPPRQSYPYRYTNERQNQTASRQNYDPRYTNQKQNQAASRQSYDPRYTNQKQNQAASRQNYDPRYTNKRNSTNGRGQAHHGSNASFGNRGYSSQQSRAESYVNSRREAQYRAERERRRAYEREMEEARRIRRQIEYELKQEEKMRRKKERKKARKLFFGRALVCLIIFAILALATGILLTLHFISAPDSLPSTVNYTFGDPGKTVRTADDSTAFRNGKTYVCFNDVADFLSLSVTGNTESMRFVFSADTTEESGSEGDGNEDSVTFMMDSRTVIINTQKMTLPSESFLYGETVWVTTDFIDEFIEGLAVTVDGKNISVTRMEDTALSTDDETVYLPVFLKLKEAAPIPGTDDGEDDKKDPQAEPMPEVTFTSDLSAYEEYMSPEEAGEYLILVNNTSRLDGTHIPSDLTAVINTRQDGRETQELRLYAAKALEALFIELYAAGYTDVSVMSGYRSFASQEYLHNYYIELEMSADHTLTWEAAKALVLTYSAEAGTSEHQTGLCIDMHNLSSADRAFANTEAYTWLKENAWKFGYILRFPENKTDLTGISFEPWHWRYVGRSAAWEITSRGICLEEYGN